MALVLFEEQGSNVGVITLNDPDNLNAMGEDLAQEFSTLVAGLRAKSRQYAALILTGAGRAFSAGGNLQMLKDKTKLTPEENRQRMLAFYESFLCLRSLNVPLIAAINGHAVGAGLCLACACDIRLASEKARLGLTFTRLGLHPGMGATYFLPRIVGNAVATELLLTGKVISAAEGLSCGLVSRLSPEGEVLKNALQVAEEIKLCGPESIRQLLESLRGPDADLKKALEREASCQSSNYAGAEFLEGVQATIDKRPAQFKFS